jgi:hypothetical protein
MTNTRLIAQGPVRFGATNVKKTATMSNSLIVASAITEDTRLTKHVISDSSIFSTAGFNLKAGNTSTASTYTGISTFASGGDMIIYGSSKVYTSPDGELGVGLALITEGSVTLNGSSDWFVNALVGGTFTYHGTTTLHGGVSAKGSITVDGGIDIDSGLQIVNDDLNDLDFLLNVSEQSRR